jgi:hypothetical protein
MRILLAALLVAFTALVGAPVRAADMPDYPDIEVPEVDYGLQGSFYLRGSAGFNMLWAQEHVDTSGCTCSVATGAGYGYSVGAGFGYETGTGLRFDGTVDYLANDGLTDGTNTLSLRSTIILANAYYDFSFGGTGSAEGGFGAYVGGGIGAAYNQVSITPTDPTLPDGANWAAAASATAGVTYDMGNWVADLGYRLIYMPTITNNAYGMASWYINGNTIHEIRGTVRYRLQ